MEIRSEADFKGGFTSCQYNKDEVVLELKGVILKYPNLTSIQIGFYQYIENPIDSFINPSFNPKTKSEKGAVVTFKILSKRQEIIFNYNSTEDKLTAPFKFKYTEEWFKRKNG